MTGRHADASVKSALRNVAWLLVPVAVLAALAVLALGAYFFFTSSNFLVTFSILWVVQAGILVRGLTRPRWKGSCLNWAMVGVLLATSYQIIAALARQHIWLADRPHLVALISDWTTGVASVFIGIALVLGIRSGELLFWRSDPTETETGE